MTRDDLLRMAREAGFSVRRDLETPKSYDCIAGYGDALELFAELVAAAEREACAAICEELESFWAAEKDAALLSGDVALSNATSGEPRAARAIATAIRARGAALEKRS